MDPWVQDAARRVGVDFDAQRVLVFGSRAHGTATRRSDLDLLIVAETALPTLARMERAMRLLADLPCPVEALVFTPAELEQRSGSKFLQEILRTGVVAYEREETAR